MEVIKMKEYQYLIGKIIAAVAIIVAAIIIAPVSYTHLDVYKRQDAVG